jgi:hypothetical protein
MSEKCYVNIGPFSTVSGLWVVEMERMRSAAMDVFMNFFCKMNFPQY